MRPDENPELVGMGVGTATCTKCRGELYLDASDSICTTCALKEDSRQCAQDVADLEGRHPEDEVTKRHEDLDHPK